MAADDDGRQRRDSRRVWTQLRIAIESVEIKLGGPLTEAAAAELRAQLGRFVDLGMELERRKTVEQAQRADRAEEREKRLRERIERMRKAQQSRDPRQE